MCIGRCLHNIDEKACKWDIPISAQLLAKGRIPVCFLPIKGLMTINRPFPIILVPERPVISRIFEGERNKYSHRKVVLKDDWFSSVLLIRRKTQTMQRLGEALQRSQRPGGKAGNYKTTSQWL